MLIVKQLYLQRGPREFFFGLDFTLHPGELLQITGTNGVGKTTLLRLLAGLTLPHHGEIIRKTSCAYLSHRPGFTPWLSVHENLHFTQNLYQSSTKNISELLRQFSLTDCQKLFPTQLSAGQQQRLAFAQLLLSGAQFWLLDEPTSSLDTDGAIVCQQALQYHLAQGGMVALTTHQALTWKFPIKHLQLREFQCGIFI